jgi:hypothetical protein
MDVTKPYKFIGFGVMDVTKPYKFRGFGVMEVSRSSRAISGATEIIERSTLVSRTRPRRRWCSDVPYPGFRLLRVPGVPRSLAHFGSVQRGSGGGGGHYRTR